MDVLAQDALQNMSIRAKIYKYIVLMFLTQNPASSDSDCIGIPEIDSSGVLTLSYI